MAQFPFFGNPFNNRQQENIQKNQQQNSPGPGNTQPQNNQNTSLEGNGSNRQQQSGVVPDQNQQNNQNQNQQNNQQQSNNNQSGGGDPLMRFDELWQNAPTVDANGNAVTPPAKKSYVPSFKPEQLNEIVGKMDFVSRAATPERMAAITAGGEGATRAMFEVMQDAIRQATLVSFQAGSKLTETAITNAEQGFLGQVPDHVKDIMTQNSITSSNPLMSNPKFSAVIDATRQQFQTKFPKATPAQIEKGVNAYFDDMYSEMTGIKQQGNTKVVTETEKLRVGAPDANWETWADDNSSLNNIFGDPNQQIVNPNQNQNQGQQQNNPNQQVNNPQSGTYTF